MERTATLSLSTLKGASLKRKCCDTYYHLFYEGVFQFLLVNHHWWYSARCAFTTSTFSMASLSSLNI